jgi:hypothetical protein
MAEGPANWYQIPEIRTALKYTAYGFFALALAVALPRGCGAAGDFVYDAAYRGRVETERVRMEQTTRVECQRLEAIEELLRAQGKQMTPQELQQFLRENRLQGSEENTPTE